MIRTILLVEDNEDDVFLMRQSIKKAKITNPLQTVEDGREVLNYLQGFGKFNDRAEFPLPFLILLDLKLPLLSGLEVLRWIRERPEFETMLVVVLTASQEERDVDSAYRMGANSYLVKPPSVEKLDEMTKSLGDYWLGKNVPPVLIGAVSE
jgi:CheY-like chemotaxis protein